MAHQSRKARDEVVLGISDDTVFAGDHIAYFYETDADIAFAPTKARAVLGTKPRTVTPWSRT